MMLVLAISPVAHARGNQKVQRRLGVVQTYKVKNDRAKRGSFRIYEQSVLDKHGNLVKTRYFAKSNGFFAHAIGWVPVVGWLFFHRVELQKTPDGNFAFGRGWKVSTSALGELTTLRQNLTAPVRTPVNDQTTRAGVERRVNDIEQKKQEIRQKRQQIEQAKRRIQQMKQETRQEERALERLRWAVP
jgi:hypothetical protein